MGEQQSSYRQITKATSLFGGVQLVKILVAVARSKVIAILLGTSGMGVAGLFNSTISLVSGLTNLGLSTSAVKDIAAAESNGFTKMLATKITALQRLIWLTGTFGALMMVLFSPILSNFAFGNGDFTIAFILLSLSILFNQLTTGNLAVLQGLRKLNYIAKSGTLGSVSGLIISLPLYYFFGVDGIVPAIVISSISLYLISKYFRGKIKLEKIKLSPKATIQEGKNMLIMGFAIALNGMLLMGSSYIITVYISSTGGIDDVGLYTAGIAIVNNYVGLVFTAMLTDYYPRLAAVANNSMLSEQVINQQADIAIIILGPIINGFLVFSKVLIVLLLSSKFIMVSDMLNWVMLGVLFKAASWPIGFYFIAKGDTKIFIISELIANLYMLTLNIIGYSFLGLEGLGISFSINYFVYFIQVFIIAKFKYDLILKSSYFKLFFSYLSLALACFITIKLFFFPYSTIIGIFFMSISIILAYKQLEKRLGIKALILNMLNKRKKPE